MMRGSLKSLPTRTLTPSITTGGCLSAPGEPTLFRYSYVNQFLAACRSRCSSSRGFSDSSAAAGAVAGAGVVPVAGDAGAAGADAGDAATAAAGFPSKWNTIVAPL